MPSIRKKNSKVKTGFSAPYTPKMLKEATEEAHIPMWQSDGGLRYLTQKDFQWLVDNDKIDMPEPTHSKQEDNPASSE